jgi:hypothetical protein
MQLRLTYSGFLMGSNKSDTRAKHKHEIRKVFHTQLKRFWDHHPYLKIASMVHPTSGLAVPDKDGKIRLVRDHLAAQFTKNGYQFVPLAGSNWHLHCSLSILFLRPDVPGGLLKSADIDNRLKTLFDALRMPANQSELGGYEVPGEDETPFFCLLEDDALIANVSVDTDMLLEAVDGTYDANHARLVITVNVRPYVLGWQTINFS